MALDCKRLELPNHVSKRGLAPEKCLAVTIDDVLTKQECCALVVRASPALQYVTAASRVVDGIEYAVPIQTPKQHRLSVLHDRVLATRLWYVLQHRAKAALEEFVARAKSGPPVGLNPRLRVLNYTGRDVFEPHFDLPVRDEIAGSMSLITVLVYLNDGGGGDFDGGDTVFLDATDYVHGASTTVTPATGHVVLFEHGLYHASTPLVPLPAGSEAEGAKWVLRTDVMFDDEPCALEEPEVLDLGFSVPTVGRLLECLGLERALKPLQDIGLAGTIDAFLAPGDIALRCMLSECDLDDEEADRLMEAARSASVRVLRPTASSQQVVRQDQQPAEAEDDALPPPPLAPPALSPRPPSILKHHDTVQAGLLAGAPTPPKLGRRRSSVRFNDQLQVREMSSAAAEGDGATLPQSQPIEENAVGGTEGSIEETGDACESETS